MGASPANQILDYLFDFPPHKNGSICTYTPYPSVVTSATSLYPSDRSQGFLEGANTRFVVQFSVSLQICSINMYGFEALTFNVHGGYLEAIVRGYRSGLLTASDYNNLCQCETLDDIKMHLSATEYGPYLQNG